MLASALCFTVMTVLVKLLADRYAAPVQIFYRQLAALVLLSPLILRRGRKLFQSTRPGLLAFRAGAGAAALIFANYGYQYLPMAFANALSFTRALWIVPLSVFVLREGTNWARVGATLVGFAGVLIVLGLTPLPDEALLPTLAALASAMLFAFTITSMKVMTRDHSIQTILAWNAVLGVAFAAPPALLMWTWPDLGDLFILMLMGALAIATQACFAKALQRGDAAAIAPIDYTRLLFALLFGLLFFNETPTWNAIVGGCVIAGAAIYLSWREHRSNASSTRGGDGA